jgi:hypothetical protein
MSHDTADGHGAHAQHHRDGRLHHLGCSCTMPEQVLLVVKAVAAALHRLPLAGS